MEINNFINQMYSKIENMIKKDGNNPEKREFILREIRRASLDGDIQSFEEIHLMDLLELEKADDIDEGYINQISEKTGGISTEFEKEEAPDMSFLDDFEERNEKEEGFLNFLK